MDVQFSVGLTGDIFGGEFNHFVNKKFEKRIFCWKFIVFGRISGQKREKNRSNGQIAYDMKGYFRFLAFIFWKSSNLTKYIYLWTLTTCTTSQNWKEKSTDCDFSMHSLYTVLSYPQRKGKIIEGLKIFVTFLFAFASLFNF